MRCFFAVVEPFRYVVVTSLFDESFIDVTTVSSGKKNKENFPVIVGGEKLELNNPAPLNASDLYMLFYFYYCYCLILYFNITRRVIVCYF